MRLKVPGALLLECMIGFVLVTTSIVLGFQWILAIIQSYADAKQQMEVLSELCNKAETVWASTVQKKGAAGGQCAYTTIPIQPHLELPYVPDMHAICIQAPRDINRGRRAISLIASVAQ